MQYALLIYENESRWNTTSETDQKAMFAEYHAFTESIAKSGQARRLNAFPIARCR